MAIGIVGEAVVGEGREVWLRLQSPWLPTPFAASCGVGCTQRRELSVGETLTQASAAQPKLFVGMVLILIFAEALGLYGLIVGLILAAKASS